MKELIQALSNQGIITVTDIQRMTTLELLLSIIERMNELHVFTKEGIEAVQQLLDKGTQEEVIAQLNKWLQDGTFDTLINQTALKEVNDRLDETVKKGRNYNTNVGAENPFFEIINPSSSASLHLTNSSGFSGPYIMGIGKDFEGTGLALPNKANGHMISGRQYSSVTEGNWLWGSQESTHSALIKLESNVVDAAPLIQIQSITQATDSQRLIVVGDRAGTAGTVYANGKLQWNREIDIYDRQGTKDVFLSISRGTAEDSQSHIRYNSRGIEFYTFTGTSGKWYPFKISADSNSLLFSGGDTTNTVGEATFNELIKLQNNKIGFFGVTPVTKPTNVAVTVEAIHSALVNLGLIS